MKCGLIRRFVVSQNRGKGNSPRRVCLFADLYIVSVQNAARLKLPFIHAVCRMLHV